MNNPSQDAGIPVLTEIIPSRPRAEPLDDIPELPVSAALPSRTAYVPPAPSAQQAPPQTSAFASPFAAEAAEAHRESAAPIDGWLDSEWTRLEQKISERALNTLLDRIDPLLEEQIRESISASLDEAMDTIRANLQLSIEQLVRESVAEEIRKLDFSKNKNI